MLLTDSRGHQVNLVRIAHTVYAVDVGFGGPGMTRPLPIIDGEFSKWGATDAEMRL
jgi:arylamine N-acetyltransferase